jgi:HK97 family phage major capsid protein
MPLPKPKPDETEQQYVSRCIRAETNASPDRPAEQIQAMCFQAWRDKDKKACEICGAPAEKAVRDIAYSSEPGDKWWTAEPGSEWHWRCDAHPYQAKEIYKNTLKAIGSDDDTLRVANYIVLFGGRDLEGIASDNKNADGTLGEFFTPQTELESSYTKTGRLLVDWEHGQDSSPDAPGEDDPLGYVDWSTAKADGRGVWVERALFRHNAYVKWLAELVDAGIVGTSSEAVPSKVEKAKDGEIKRWPLKRDTLTVTPMEPRNASENVIQALKALGFQIADTTETEPEAGDASPAAAVVEEALESKSIEQHQEVSMSEEQTQVNEAPAVDVAAIAKAAAEEAVKAYVASLPKEEPKATGLIVTEDEADKAIKARPYKGLGEFLMDVKNAALGQVDQRLLPLRSTDAMDEGGFSLNKALGDDFVGGVTKAAYQKAAWKQTGLNEGIGSQGGFLVDTDRAGGILQRVYDTGDLLRRVDMVGISAGSNGMTFNAINETSRADGSRMGGIRAYWTAEGGTKTASQPEFRQLELKLHKVVGLVYATDELLQDASALESWIMSNLPDELRFVVEDAIINGTGVGMPQGILASACLVSVVIEAGQAAATIVVPNIVKMWSRMWARSRRNAIWLVNQDVEPQLFQLQLPVGTGGQAVYMPPGGLSATPYATLMGRPVVAHESCPTLGTVGDIILADMSQYQMIEKGGIQSASSIHVQFVYDETVFRFVYRCDGESKWNSALTPNSGSGNTLSPFVALATRA